MLFKLYLEGFSEDEIYTEEGHCPNCGKKAMFRMKNNGLKLTFYGLPIISVAGAHSLECCNCGTDKEVKRKDYRKTLSEKLLQIKNSLVMSDYELSACEPKKLKIFRRIVKVLVSGWLAKVFSDGYFDMLLNRMKPDAEGFIFGIVAGLVVLAMYIPFAMSVNGLHIALRKRSLYKKCVKKNKKVQQQGSAVL